MLDTKFPRASKEVHSNLLKCAMGITISLVGAAVLCAWCLRSQSQALVLSIYHSLPVLLNSPTCQFKNRPSDRAAVSDLFRDSEVQDKRLSTTGSAGSISKEDIISWDQPSSHISFRPFEGQHEYCNETHEGSLTGQDGEAQDQPCPVLSQQKEGEHVHVPNNGESIAPDDGSNLSRHIVPVALDMDCFVWASKKLGSCLSEFMQLICTTPQQDISQWSRADEAQYEHHDHVHEVSLADPKDSEAHDQDQFSSDRGHDARFKHAINSCERSFEELQHGLEQLCQNSIGSHVDTQDVFAKPLAEELKLEPQRDIASMAEDCTEAADTLQLRLQEIQNHVERPLDIERRLVQDQAPILTSVPWEADHARAAEYVMGQKVERRDEGQQWQAGFVTSISPLKVTCGLVLGRSAKGYPWDQVRPVQAQVAETSRFSASTGDQTPPRRVRPCPASEEETPRASERPGVKTSEEPQKATELEEVQQAQYMDSCDQSSTDQDNEACSATSQVLIPREDAEIEMESRGPMEGNHVSVSNMFGGALKDDSSEFPCEVKLSDGSQDSQVQFTDGSCAPQDWLQTELVGLIPCSQRSCGADIPVPDSDDELTVHETHDNDSKLQCQMPFPEKCLSDEVQCEGPIDLHRGSATDHVAVAHDLTFQSLVRQQEIQLQSDGGCHTEGDHVCVRDKIGVVLKENSSKHQVKVQFPDGSEEWFRTELVKRLSATCENGTGSHALRSSFFLRSLSYADEIPIPDSDDEHTVQEEPVAAVSL
jgi:hypothetical protein